VASESDDLEALFRLAYKEFEESGRNGDNRRRELNDELALTLKDLSKADFAAPAGFVHLAADAERTTGKTEIREWIAKYLEVALREHAPELLLPPWIERLRAQVQNSIEVRCLILKQEIEKYLDLPRWHGYRPPPRPAEDYLQHQYTLLRSDFEAELNGRLETLQLRGTAEKRKSKSELPQSESTVPRPTIPAAKVESTESRRVVPFPMPNGARWEDVEIRFTGDHHVQITVLGQTDVRNYAEMDFEDGRSEKPVRAWTVLQSLGSRDGIVRLEDMSADRATIERRILEIRARFRSMFNLEGDPIPFEAGIGYRARFRVIFATSFNK
jgi:hypothetical protein